jgi:hypothetical protein
MFSETRRSRRLRRRSCYVVLGLVLVFPSDLFAALEVAAALEGDHGYVNRVSLLTLDISWTGYSDTYVIVPPTLDLPEGVELKRTSLSASAKGGRHITRYAYHIVPARKGEHSIGPIEVRYWEKGKEEESVVESEVIEFIVRPSSDVGLASSWVSILAIPVFVAVFIGIVLWRERRSKKTVPTRDEREWSGLREECLKGFEVCKALKARGEWQRFFEEVKGMRERLPGEQVVGDFEEVDSILEKIKYAGLTTAGDEAELMFRKLERRIRELFHNEQGRDLENDHRAGQHRANP